jgi:hypothetical protein
MVPYKEYFILFFKVDKSWRREFKKTNLDDLVTASVFRVPQLFLVAPVVVIINREELAIFIEKWNRVRSIISES